MIKLWYQKQGMVWWCQANSLWFAQGWISKRYSSWITPAKITKMTTFAITPATQLETGVSQPGSPFTLLLMSDSSYRKNLVGVYLIRVGRSWLGSLRAARTFTTHWQRSVGRGKVRNVKKKVTPKGFDEASRTTRVKMYKSGKQWVQCLLTRLGMIKLSSGVKPEEVRVEANLDSKTTSLLKGVLAASALIGGGAVATPHAFAEVQTSTVDSGADNNTSQNLAEANTVSLGSNNDSTGAKSQTSD